jgi:hypothetical protein
MAWDHSTFEENILVAHDYGRKTKELEPHPTFSVDRDAEGELLQLRRVLVYGGYGRTDETVYEEFLDWDSIFIGGTIMLPICGFEFDRAEKLEDLPVNFRLVVGGGHCRYKNFPVDSAGDPVRVVEFNNRNGSFRVLPDQPSDAEWQAQLNKGMYERRRPSQAASGGGRVK